jgi:hypothetical protein
MITATMKMTHIITARMSARYDAHAENQLVDNEISVSRQLGIRLLLLADGGSDCPIPYWRNLDYHVVETLQ